MNIVPISSLRLSDRVAYGGKAAALGEMWARGLPVLPGFAVHADCYRDAVTGPNRLEAAGHDVAKRLQELCARDGLTGDLIVRSSATLEDSTHHSFAGQFESVRSQNDVVSLGRAIQDVWRSATSDSAVAYTSASTGVHPGDLAMGVLVQPYLNFELAGVLFSRHPTVSVSGWMLIEYSTAQPAAIVSGEVTPARVRVRTESGQTLDELTIEGVVLASDQIELLSRAASEMCSALKADVDIEWGVAADSTVYLLQCRPMTT